MRTIYFSLGQFFNFGIITILVASERGMALDLAKARKFGHTSGGQDNVYDYVYTRQPIMHLTFQVIIFQFTFLAIATCLASAA